MSTATSDKALMAKVASGDHRAFDALANQYQPMIRRFLRRRILDEQVAEEVLNDTLLHLWQAAASFAGRAKLSTWILGVARNCACNALRKQPHWLEYREPQTLDSTGTLDVPANDEQLQHHSQEQVHAELHQALQALKQSQRNVITLSFFRGCGYQEIAGIVGCPANTVKTRVHHAKRQLQYLLNKQVLSNISATQNRDSQRWAIAA